MKKKPDPNCSCKGRGWFSGDMMGSYFIPCKKCNTHEIAIAKFGNQVYENIRLKEGCENNEEGG